MRRCVPLVLATNPSYETALIAPSCHLRAPSAFPCRTSRSRTITGELQKWHRVTLSFTGPQCSENGDPNPFLDYRLEVDFTHTLSGSTLKVPGYFAADGNAGETFRRLRKHLAEPIFLHRRQESGPTRPRSFREKDIAVGSGTGAPRAPRRKCYRDCHRQVHHFPK